eukprot:scaffold4055_cov132-Isochrysis_galbana.AAC.3
MGHATAGWRDRHADQTSLAAAVKHRRRPHERRGAGLAAHLANRTVAPQKCLLTPYALRMASPQTPRKCSIFKLIMDERGHGRVAGLALVLAAALLGNDLARGSIALPLGLGAVEALVAAPEVVE